jgi:small subunit ribosomal protein S21
MGARVVVGDGEPVGAALRRLKKRVEREGVAWEVRRRSYFVGGTELRRAKEFRKRFKAREAALVARMAAGLSGPALDAAKAAFWRRTGKP